MRRLRLAGLITTAGILLAAGGAGAQTTSTTTTTTTVVQEVVVTVEPGPAQNKTFVAPCSDVALFIQERLSFLLRRTGPTSAPLTVTYSLSGTAHAGVHYDPLPGSATFPAGAATVTVPVVPRSTSSGAIVELSMVVTGGTPLAPPATPARIQFVSPPPSGPVECGFRFTADSWNTSQTVAVGQVLHALTLEQFTPPILSPAAGTFRLLAGALPPGVELRADGSFGGTPSAAGTFVARIQACRPAPPGTCVTTDLTVNVPVTAPPLPRTGAGSPVAEIATWAGLLVILGACALALVAGGPSSRAGAGG